MPLLQIFFRSFLILHLRYRAVRLIYSHRVIILVEGTSVKKLSCGDTWQISKFCWWGKGWPVVACPSRALVVLYRILTIFACYVLTFMSEMLFLFLSTSLGCFVHGFCLSSNGLNILPWTSFTCYTKDNQQGCFRLSNWFSMRRLGPWMNHLPPAW